MVLLKLACTKAIPVGTLRFTRFFFETVTLFISHIPNAKTSLLLIRNSLLRTFAGSRIRLRTLSSDRQVTPMAQSSVTPQIHQTLDVRCNQTTQITFNVAGCVNSLTQGINLIIIQLEGSSVSVNL
jgi:hypothetical protein